MLSHARLRSSFPFPLRVAVELAVAVSAAIWVWLQASSDGVPRGALLTFLVVAAPMVGDFAITLAHRYRSGMPLRACLHRILRSSSCDGCGIPLGQLDVFPVLPYLARRGTCRCRRHRISRAYPTFEVASLLAAVVALAVCLIADADAVRVLTILLAFLPAIVMDVVHGEVDGPMFAFPFAIALATPQAGLTVALACSAGLAVHTFAAGLLARVAIRRGLPAMGPADILAGAAVGSFLTVPQAVSATVWLVLGFAVCLGLCRILGTSSLPFFGMRRHGPDDLPEGTLVAPVVPAFAIAGMMAVAFPLV